MFKKKKTIKSEYIDLQVKLKNIMGIEPGIYLSVLYLSALVLAFFAAFFMPGILNPGSKVYFESEPGKASVWVNGEYAGTTPFEGFLEKGFNEIVFKKPGFSESGEVHDTKGFIFATLFRKPGVLINEQLEVNDYRKVFEWSLDNILRWAAIEDFHESYQPEYLIAETLDSLPEGGGNSEYTDLFLEKCFKNITKDYFIPDFIRAVAVKTSGGRGLSPMDVIEIYKYITEKITENPLILLHLQNISEKSETGYFSPDYCIDDLLRKTAENVRARNIENDNSSIHDSPDRFREIVIENKNYAVIPEGVYRLGVTEKENPGSLTDAPPSLDNDMSFKTFLLARNRVTNREYYSFVMENNYWSPENAPKLISRNLVSVHYLEHWENSMPAQADMDMPVVNISFYAAEAYCRWVSEKNRQYTAVVPDEFMWEAAYRAMDNDSSTGYVLWDWCSNWFNYAEYIRPEGSMASSDSFLFYEETLSGIDKTVRGGSLETGPDYSQPWIRGALPPDWCTPFTGFRIALLMEK